MQNSLHALKSQKDCNSILKKPIKKRKMRLKPKNESINKENQFTQNNIYDNKPLFFYNDKKFFLLLKRTYYLRELEKTEKFINSNKFAEQKINLTNDEFKRLVSEFNNLIDLQNLYINMEDLLKSLRLQNKIINILKIYIINKT